MHPTSSIDCVVKGSDTLSGKGRQLLNIVLPSKKLCFETEQFAPNGSIFFFLMYTFFREVLLCSKANQEVTKVVCFV